MKKIIVLIIGSSLFIAGSLIGVVSLTGTNKGPTPDWVCDKYPDSCGCNGDICPV